MTSRDFCFWLQGFFEISDKDSVIEKCTLTTGQIEAIRNHLNLVFKHEIDPAMGTPEVQNVLQEIHDGSDRLFFNSNH